MMCYLAGDQSAKLARLIRGNGFARRDVQLCKAFVDYATTLFRRVRVEIMLENRVKARLRAN
jgi:hypothetical protein